MHSPHLSPTHAAATLHGVKGNDAASFEWGGNGQSQMFAVFWSLLLVCLKYNTLDGIHNCCSQQQRCVIMKPIKAKSGAN